MNKRLSGKVALVTGSTSGIGRAIAEAFAREGANVVLNGFGEAERVEAIRVSLERDFGVKASYDPADMTKPDEIVAMVKSVERASGAVDVLVNNAGIQHVAPVERFPPEKWDAIVAITLSAAFHSTRAALPGMKKRGWGRLINIASAHGLVASPFKSAYVAAKHGLVGFTKTVALEVAETGVTANSICPGFVLTPLVERQIEDLIKERGISRESAIRDVILAPQPSKQFVKVDEVAAMALFLASDSAAQVNGASLSIDGGWTAR